MNWDLYRKVELALVAWREARGQGRDGMRAVLCVIRNRVKGWGQSWGSVIEGRNQFSSMTVLGDSQTILYPHEPDAQFDAAMELAEGIFDGSQPDTTCGALYYCNPKTATSGWFANNIVAKADEHPLVATIGDHSFYA